MKKIVSLPLLVAAALSSSVIFAPAAISEEIIIETLTLKVFLAMPYEQRLAACAKLVDSEHIGECTTLKAPSDPAAVASRKALQAAVQQCKDKGVDVAGELAACARGAIDTKGKSMQTPAEMGKAIDMCAAHFSDSEELGKCAAGMMGKME